MSNLPTHLLGRSGIHVSRIALGTVELGLDYGIAGAGDHRRPDEAAAATLLNHALDIGVTFIDTARMYGEAEAIIGRAIGHRRSEYVLASKVATPVALRGAEAREHVGRSIETSLAALGTDHIDLMYSHSATVDEIAQGDVYAALDEARQAGKVRAVGASTYGEAAPLAAVKHGGYDCIQVAYNLLDRALEVEFLPAAQAANIGVVARSVLLKGALTHRYAYLPEVLADLRAASAHAQALAAGAGMSLPEAAYRYVLAHPAISSALVGTARADELAETVGWAEAAPLPDILLAALRQITLADPRQLSPANWPDA